MALCDIKGGSKICNGFQPCNGLRSTFSYTCVKERVEGLIRIERTAKQLFPYYHEQLFLINDQSFCEYLYDDVLHGSLFSEVIIELGGVSTM